MADLGDIEEHREWFLEYFRELKRHAPTKMLAFGGFEEGKPAGMASSLENVFWFAKLIGDPRATVLDAGAGASTWLLRRWFKHVVSTDPDAEYLAMVRRLCVMNGLGGKHFIVGLQRAPVCDYTFYDYGGAARMDLLPLAWAKTRVLAYVDDTDTREECKDWRELTLDFARENDIEARDYPEACDEYGRWGIILRRTAWR